MQQRRARIVLVSLMAAGLALTACSSATGTSSITGTGNGDIDASESPNETPKPPAELPKGGREVFPKYRLVGFSGVGGDPSYGLGRLSGDLDAKCKEIKKIGKEYAYGRKVLPVFEHISVVVTGSPGKDGLYRMRAKKAELRKYLEAARKCKGILLLNIQPGRSDFMPELKHLEEFLKQPDVGVALDPEWAMDPGKIPGRNLGRTDGAELNEVAKYLADLVAENDLPEKVMVFHQFNEAAVQTMKQLKPHEGVALVRSIDGLGGPGAKVDTYNNLKKGQPKYIHPGFKLFYSEDVNPPHGSRLMTPTEVMALRPQPEYILYE
jgi:hypothetical protein